MSDREKLIAIMAQGCRKSTEENGVPCCTESFCKDNQKHCYGQVADHLIANGVVVREKGEWILTDAELAEMSCSRCGFTYYGVHDYECMSGFCPDCGAKMEG